MFVFYVCINEYIHAGVETASYAELPGVEGVVAAWLTAWFWPPTAEAASPIASYNSQLCRSQTL